MERKLKFRPTAVCAVVVMIATCRGLALDPNQPASSYLRKTFTVEDGLPANDVHAILQTQNGFLWVGTDAGLARFDGERFTAINIGPGVAQQIPVKSLLETPEGSLWVGTDAGLAHIPGAALDHFDRTLVTMYHVGVGQSDQILCIHRSRAGTLWVGTSGGLYRFDRGNFSSIIPHDMISRIEESSDGHLLIITGHGFVEWDGAQIVPHPEIAQQLGVSTNLVFDVFEDHEGVTWYCTIKGVARRVGGRITRIEPYGLPHGAAWRVYEDPQGSIWVLTEQGLFRASATGLEPLLPVDSISFAYSDREGGLWVSDENEGLVRFKDRAVWMYTTSDGLPNNRVRTVLRSHDGTLWVGNNCGGISRFDGRRFRNYNEKDGLSNSCVWAMAEDAEHNLWIGTWGGGLYRFRDGHFTQYSKQQGLPSIVVVCIAAAPDGSLWIATDLGLSHMQNGHFRNYSVADGLSSDLITTVYQDRSGTIWVGTSVAIDRLVGDRFVAVPRDSRSSNALFRTLREDSSGDLYAFSDVNGISRLKNNRLVSVNETLVWGSAIESDQHDLWFSGRQGIFRVAAGDLRHLEQDRASPLDYSSFGPDDGMNSKECDSFGQPNMAITADDTLWVATVKGLARLDGQRFQRTNHRPAIYMEGVDVGRTRASPGRELILPPGTSHVEFHFTAVDLVSAEKIRLQYRLDGVDPSWLDADSTRTAIYNSIPVGAHSFHIRACNRDGVWDHSGIVYSVIQQPFPYETTWFRLSGLAGIGLLVVGIYRWRVRQLKSQEKRLWDVVNTIPTMAFVSKPDGYRTFVNKGWVEYTGMTVEQSLGSGWHAAIHPDDLKGVLGEWEAALPSGRPMYYEARHRRAKDRQYRWFMVRVVGQRDRSGKVVKWFGTITDIEDRKRADQKFRGLLESAPDAMVVMDQQGQILLVNAQVERLFGYKREELLGQDVVILMPERFRGRHSLRRTEYFAHPHARSMGQDLELYARRSDGTEFPVEISISPLETEEGTLVSGAVRDITERKHTEQEREKLRQLEADLAHINRVSMLGEMAASLAHEIKQPIAAAITSANTCIEWLAHEPPDLDRARAAATRIDRYGNRAAEIINRIRSLYRKSPSEHELVDVNGIIQEMLTLLKCEADRYSIDMHSELAAELAKVVADRVQLQQVFMNLMLNGIEAMQDEGGELTVKSQLQDSQLVFSVTDTGVGLPTEKMEQIFSAFFTTKPQGSGMGLAISRSIVESHGGRLWASANDGRGATFHLSLPIATHIVQETVTPPLHSTLPHPAPEKKGTPPCTANELNRGDELI